MGLGTRVPGGREGTGKPCGREGVGGRGQIQTKTQCWKAAERESPDQVVRNGEKTEVGERMRQEREKERQR